MNAEGSVVAAILEYLTASAHLSPEALLVLASVLELVAIATVSVVVAWVFKRTVLSRLEAWSRSTHNDVDDRLVYFVRRFYNAIVLVLVTMAGLHVFGVEITPLLAGAGIAGVAVAYAGKDLLGNMIAGGVLLVDQPIRIGDRILVDTIGSE